MRDYNKKHEQLIASTHEGVFYPEVLKQQLIGQITILYAQRLRENKRSTFLNAISDLLSYSQVEFSTVAPDDKALLLADDTIAESVMAQTMANQVLEKCHVILFVLQTKQKYFKAEVLTKLSHAIEALAALSTAWLQHFKLGDVMRRQQMLSQPAIDELLIVFLDLSAYRIQPQHAEVFTNGHHPEWDKETQRHLHIVRHVETQPNSPDFYYKLSNFKISPMHEMIYARLAECLFDDLPVAAPTTFFSVIPFVNTDSKPMLDSRRTRFVIASEAVSGLSLETIVNCLDAMQFFKAAGLSDEDCRQLIEFADLNCQLPDARALSADVRRKALKRKLMACFESGATNTGASLTDADAEHIVNKCNDISVHGRAGLIHIVNILSLYPKLNNNAAHDNVLSLLKRLDSFLQHLTKLKTYFPDVDALERIERIKKKMAEVAPNQLSALIFLNLLTVNRDGKFDDYLVHAHRPANLTPTYHVIGIDNDLIAEEPPFVRTDEGCNSNFLLSLLLLTWFDHPVDPSVLQSISAKLPLVLIADWLVEVSKLANIGAEYINALNIDDPLVLDLIDLPITLPSWFLDHMLVVLRKVNQLPQGLTHSEMITAIYPTLGEFYQHIFRTRSAYYFDAQDALFSPSTRVPLHADDAEFLAHFTGEVLPLKDIISQFYTITLPIKLEPIHQERIHLSLAQLLQTSGGVFKASPVTLRRRLSLTLRSSSGDGPDPVPHLSLSSLSRSTSQCSATTDSHRSPHDPATPGSGHSPKSPSPSPSIARMLVKQRSGHSSSETTPSGEGGGSPTKSLANSPWRRGPS